MLHYILIRKVIHVGKHLIINVSKHGIGESVKVGAVHVGHSSVGKKYVTFHPAKGWTYRHYFK